VAKDRQDTISPVMGNTTLTGATTSSSTKMTIVPSRSGIINVMVTIPVKIADAFRPMHAPVLNYRCQPGAEAIALTMMQRGLQDSDCRTAVNGESGGTRTMYQRTDVMRYILNQVLADDAIAEAVKEANK